MKPNPEAQLAVKLYEQHQKFHDRVANGDSYKATLDAAKLCSMARSLNRLHEIQCNRPTSDREENRIKELAKAILKLLVSYNLQGEIDSDPRGYAVYIHFSNGSSNSWGGSEKGWGI